MIEVKSINFHDFKENVKEKEGIVCIGCSDFDSWVKGISDEMKEEKITNTSEPEKLWESIYMLKTSGERYDLAFVFNPECEFEVGHMAIWRLRFGDCSWISDYVVNYASDF